ncbi:MAG TPA: hypothetical protein VFE53_08260 [Mucilaginibacter sp.]|jgi:hypothetical protein|nr:hypothetical protein [Mucilaginibacter sp.]
MTIFIAFIFLASSILIIVIFFVFRWLHGIWRIAKMIKLLTPEILESAPYYKLLDVLLFGISHAMERHGPMTTIAQQIKRAKNGVSPDGIRGNPVHSGRWNSYYTLLQAVETAKQMWEKEGLKKKKCYVFKFDKSIGMVVKQLTDEREKSQIAFVVINKQSHVITAFPVLESAVNVNDVVPLTMIEKEIF